MKWLELNKEKSQKTYEELIENNKNNIDNLQNTEFDSSYEELKKDLYQIFYEVVDEMQITLDIVNKKAYEFDYRFALRIYHLLNNKYHFNKNLANNDGIWRYMQIKVCPYLVYLRWGYNPDRNYKRTSRIWLKNLWWYVFLAWKNDEQQTIEILKNNTSDTIVQLVERTGKYGYRVELYKEILYQKYIRNINADIFRKIMILNTMRVKVIDPYLVNGGIEKYVDNLLNDAIIEEE